MSKIVKLIVSIALAVLAIIVCTEGVVPQTRSTSQIDEPVTSVEELATLMSNLPLPKSISIIQLSNIDWETASRYSNFTLTSSSTFSSNQHTSYSEATLDGSRELTIYTTSDAILYTLKGAVNYAVGSYNSAYSSNSEKSAVSFEMELYAINGEVFCRVSKFDIEYVENGGAKQGLFFPPEYLNSWIHIDGSTGMGELESIFESAHSINMNMLESMGKAFSDLSGYGFQKSGTLYTVKNTAFDSFIKSLTTALSDYNTSEMKYTGSATIDLSTPTNPFISLDYSFNQTDPNVISGHEKDNLSFRNINSTTLRRIDTSSAVPASLIEFREYK